MSEIKIKSKQSDEITNNTTSQSTNTTKKLVVF